MAYPTSKETIPCALKHHIFTTRKKADELSLNERLLAFQHWVAYIRTRKPDPSSKQRFKCPLSLCTTSHADFESLLNHVAVCPRLVDARYYCSECEQHEHFPTNFDSPFASRQNALRRMGSTVKEAVSFFKHLSLRGCTSRKFCSLRRGQGASELHSESRCNAELPTRQTSQTKHLQDPVQQPSELAARHTCMSSSKELFKADTAGSIYQGQEVPRKPIPRYELMDTEFGNSDTDSINSNLLWSPMISPITYQDSLMSSKTHEFSPLSSPAKTTDGYHTQGETQMTDVLDASVFPCERMDRRADREFLKPTVPGNITTTHPWTHLRASYAAVETLTTRDRIEELHRVLQTLWSEWLQRLSFSADLLQRMTELSPDRLLEQGMQILQDAILGKLPRSFQQNLTLVLLALACAYVLHQECNVHYWNNLLQDTMRWRYMIEDLDDRKTFVQIMALLATQSQELHINLHTKDVFQTMDQSSWTSNLATSRHRPTVSAPPALGTNQVIERSVVASGDPNDILGALKKEILFTTCLEFLDNIAYAEVLKSSTMYKITAPWYTRQCVANIEDMKSSIVCNLKQLPEMNIISNEINDVYEKIATGLLRNPREVEVTLLSHCTKACRYTPIYGNCRQIISSVCDRPTIGEGPSWRARHHAALLDEMMAICREEREDFNAISSPIYEKNAAGTLKPKRPQCESDFSPSTSSTTSTHTLRNSASTATLPTSPSAVTENTDNTTFREGSTRDNLTEDPPPVSPRSQLSPSPNDGKSQCTQCDGVFLKCNLSRHFHAVHQPRPENIVCQETSCSSTFTRHDNLEKHMRKKHGEVTPKKQGMSNKRRRPSQAQPLAGSL